MENIETTKSKAEHCLNCIKKPCSVTCPLSNDTTGFIKVIKQEKYKEAYELLCETTVLQPICGRICPHTKQCQKGCVRGIKGEPVDIGSLEAFIGDLAIKNNWKIPTAKEKAKENKKIAVIGSGPAGLTCAAFLAKEGYQVTIYEKHSKLGGILTHGIPEFRLDNTIVDETIKKILELGIEVKTNTKLVAEHGENFITLQELEKEYDAIFLSFGANISSKMEIEGENLQGVYGGNELLESGIHPDYCGKNVAVIGGGNVAMDTSRTIKKLGAKTVNVIYRRAEEQMPAEKKEIQEAKEEGIEFLFQTNILKIIGDKQVKKIECIKTELKQKEGDDRLSPVNIEGSDYFMDIDYVIMAVGSSPEKEITSNLNIKTDSRGKIEVNENNQTSNPKIFAGGDLIGTKGTVAWAARSGRDAAENIIKFFENK